MADFFGRVSNAMCCSQGSFFTFNGTNEHLAAPLFVSGDGDATILLYVGYYGKVFANQMVPVLEVRIAVCDCEGGALCITTVLGWPAELEQSAGGLLGCVHFP